MSLTGSSFDVFVSYAGVDNLAVGEERGWVEQFHEHLEVALAKRVGKLGVVRVWRDAELAPNQFFDDTIAKRVTGSAVFIALMSQGYLESEYCLKELRTFCEHAKGSSLGVAVGDRSRILNVNINQITHQLWPPELAGISGLAMYDAGGPNDLGAPLDPREKSFAGQVRKLASAIHDTLAAVQGAQRRMDVPGASSGLSNAKLTESLPAAPTVYLADVADSLHQMRRRTLNQLTQSGIRVVTDIPPPYYFPEHNEHLIRVVADADLAVHLFDHLPGRTVHGDPEGRSYPHLQMDLCRQHAPAQFVWLPPELDIKGVEEEGHSALLRQLDEGGDNSGLYEFVRSSSAGVPAEILEMLKRLERHETDTGSASAVLVDTHVKDQRHAFQVGGCLMDNGFDALVNPQEDDPRSHMDVLAERLGKVATLIVVFGQVAKEWVDERISAAVQLALNEGFDLAACGVYVAPPRKEAGDLQVKQKFLKVHVVDNSDSVTLDERRLMAFLAKARRSATQ